MTGGIVKRSVPRKRLNSSLSSAKGCVFYSDTRYLNLLVDQGIILDFGTKELASESKTLLHEILTTKNPCPSSSLIYCDENFLKLCNASREKNEAFVTQYLLPCLVPGPLALTLHNIEKLDFLIELYNDRWDSCLPFMSPVPQPDFAVGFCRQAFTSTQLLNLSKFAGDYVTEASEYLSNFRMLFPFLTCEVKCGTTGLNVADRQNAHSMAVAVRATAKLFCQVKLNHLANR